MTAKDAILNSTNKTIPEIHYKITRKLGEGMFSTVKLATHSLTGEQVAIKILEKTRIASNEDKERIKREINILKKVCHFNISKLYQVVENKLTIYLVQEYIKGKEFMEYLTKKGRLKEVEACKFYHQIISGLEYIHQCGIAHRDFKPENILLTNDNTILKIIDFGLSNIYEGNQLLKTACGSPCYVCPEMVKEENYNGELSDIWSSGIILYLMLCGKLPFFHEQNEIMYQQILSGKFELPDYLSDNAKDLLSKLLEIDPNKRIRFAEIKKHPWFTLINKKYLIHKGININEDIIPIDEEIIQKMEKLGFDKMEIRYNIIKNFHNKITAVYELFLKQKIDSGKKSVADLNSDLYDEYINDAKNKIKFYGTLEEALKNRICDDNKKIDVLPNYNEEQYNKDNENLIVGDTGSVIERLIKAGKFAYDEENMCISRVATRNQKKENKKDLNNIKDGDSKFKTLSQINNIPPKKEQTTEENSEESFKTNKKTKTSDNTSNTSNKKEKKSRKDSPRLSVKKTAKIKKSLKKNEKTVELIFCDNENDEEEKVEKKEKKEKKGKKEKKNDDNNDNNEWYKEIEAMILKESKTIPRHKKSSSMHCRKKNEEKKNAPIYEDNMQLTESILSSKELSNALFSKNVKLNKNDNKKNQNVLNHNNSNYKKKPEKMTSKPTKKDFALNSKFNTKKTLLKSVNTNFKKPGMNNVNNCFQSKTNINESCNNIIRSTRTIKFDKNITKSIRTEKKENNKIEKKGKSEKILKKEKTDKKGKNEIKKSTNNVIQKFEVDDEIMNAQRKRGGSCAKRTNKIKI